MTDSNVEYNTEPYGNDAHPDEIEGEPMQEEIEATNTIANNNIVDANIEGGELKIGAGDNVLRFNGKYGLWAGAAEFANAPFSVDMQGNVTASSLTASGYIEVGGAADDVNSGTTQISPGKVLISGDASLDDWSSGDDATMIAGGQIYTGSITATEIDASTITTSEVNFTVVGTDNVVGTINSSTEGIEIEGDFITLDGNVVVDGTFSITASDNITDVTSGADVTADNSQDWNWISGAKPEQDADETASHALDIAHTGSSAPSSPQEGWLWHDTSPSPDELKRYNGSSWNKIATLEASWSGVYNDGGKPKDNADKTSNNTAKDIVNLPDATSGDGLYATSNYLGYYDSTSSSWKAFFNSDGHFKFEGDTDNYIEWAGSTLDINGDLHAKDILAGGTITGVDVVSSDSDDKVKLDSGNSLKFYKGGTLRTTIRGATAGAGGIVLEDGDIALNNPHSILWEDAADSGNYATLGLDDTDHMVMVLGKGNDFYVYPNSGPGTSTDRLMTLNGSGDGYFKGDVELAGHIGGPSGRPNSLKLYPIDYEGGDQAGEIMYYDDGTNWGYLCRMKEGEANLYHFDSTSGGY